MACRFLSCESDNKECQERFKKPKPLLLRHDENRRFVLATREDFKDSNGKATVGQAEGVLRKNGGFVKTQAELVRYIMDETGLGETSAKERVREDIKYGRIVREKRRLCILGFEEQ